MARLSPNKPPQETIRGSRPHVTSYDNGYEHGLQHWLDVQQMVEAADAELSAHPLIRAKAS